MTQYIPVLKSCPLFRGIEERDLSSMLDCLQARVKTYPKGRAVLTLGSPATVTGVVLKGAVHVCRVDAEGNRTVLAALGPGDLFGEAYACAGTISLPVSVWAERESTVLLLGISKVMTVCSSACAFHQILVKNLMCVLAEKNIFLTGKMEHLAKRTLREKLLSYLGEQAALQEGGSFTVPFDRQGLADYLCTDRSALSRELGRLREEGILDCNKNRFRLL